MSLVVPSSEGDELTIWDSMESEFASGLEYQGTFEYVLRSSSAERSMNSSLQPSDFGPRLELDAGYAVHTCRRVFETR